MALLGALRYDTCIRGIIFMILKAKRVALALQQYLIAQEQYTLYPFDELMTRVYLSEGEVR